MHACSSHRHCVNDAIRKAESICRSRKLRFTDLRCQVLKIIWRDHKPAKAYDILDKLKDKDYRAKPSTVYRTLDFLLDQGLIHKLNSLNAYIGCSHPLKHDECYFLICSECQEVKECCNRILSDAIAKTSAKNKFNSKHAMLEIEGLCMECRNSKRRKG